MLHESRAKAACVALACCVILAVCASASAQGRGRGAGAGTGGGRGAGTGGATTGRPTGVGVGGGIGRSAESSGGRAERGRENASDKSSGRSEEGLERARMRSENSRRAEEELRKHPQMPGRLNTTANDLREGYRSALDADPGLKFGEYVAATRVAANLGSRHPGVTREAVLAGLARGDSLGETLRNLGVGEREARSARDRAEREIKEAMRRP